MKANVSNIIERSLSTGSAVGLMGRTDDTVVIAFNWRLKNSMLRGLTSGEIRSGKTNLNFATKRNGSRVIEYMAISKEAAIALRDLLCEAKL